MPNIHPTAIIHESAKIDPSVRIGPHAVIGEDVEIGADSVIGAGAHVEFTHMGKNNKLFPGCYVGGEPQDLKFSGEKSLLIMGDSNTVRECVTLNRGTKDTGKTVIGSGCLFMAYSHVAHDCRIGNNVILVNSVALAGHITIGDYSIMGGISACHQFVHIGRCCMISGGSMIGKDIPPFCTAQGDRATLRGLNLLGMRRLGLPRESIKGIKDAYKKLFLSEGLIEPALAELKEGDNCPEVKEMIAFVERALENRGIMRQASTEAAKEKVTL
jgi:UDP-N-acetylglucosamine acyltransferase